MVLYRLLLGASLGTGAFLERMKWTGIQFLSTVAAAIVLGVIFGLLFSLLLRLVRSSSAAQLGLTVTSAYLSFIVAEHFFHVSGVIATMTVGLWLAGRAQESLAPEAAQGMPAVWEFLALTANTLVFFAVGLVVDVPSLRSTLMYIPLAVLFVYLARALSASEPCRSSIGCAT